MLETLYKLQKVEAEEAAVLASQKNSGEYRLLRELKGEFDRLKKTLQQRQDQLGALQQEIQDMNVESAQIDDRLVKERGALYDGSIANIRELSAREAQISSLEERNAAIFASLEQKQTELRRVVHQARILQQRITEQHQLFTEKYQKYESLRQDWQSNLSELAGHKESLLFAVDEQAINWYQEQKPLFAGLPVAKLDANHVCDGCRTVVTPMLYKRTTLGERTRCEKCGRYLFIEE